LRAVTVHKSERTAEGNNGGPDRWGILKWPTAPVNATTDAVSFVVLVGGSTVSGTGLRLEPADGL